MFEKEFLFWFCALAGSGMFIIQFALYFMGADMDDPDHGSVHNFKWLSKQAVTGFLMMFGWIGLACKKELGFSAPVTAAIAIGAGTIAMLITGLIFKIARKLHSTGSVFSLEEAIGKKAFVYQQIPKEGSGKISVSIYGMTHEIDAVSLNGEEINSFTQVEIIKKADERTVVVNPIK